MLLSLQLLSNHMPDWISVSFDRENYATWSMLIIAWKEGCLFQRLSGQETLLIKAWKEYVDKSMEYVEKICNYSELGVTTGRHLLIFARLSGLIPSSLSFIS
ncbi:hypothetical protein HanOQP8_Chr01g0010771 [Helianthus annuus]|nr:hypothetical protein HanOQP8_Chr01g0010771 [Helianthus annuus]